MAAGLYVIAAGKAETAVVLRRGPSKQVQMIKWDTKNDTFEYGQWFKGRVYEDKCSLSPSGGLFIYFAAKHKGRYPAWTAISKPPYFTALALWPANTVYGGGGFFKDDRTILLNHDAREARLAPGFSVPSHIKVIYSTKSSTDVEIEGWEMTEKGKATVNTDFYSPKKSGAGHAEMAYTMDPPRVFSKKFEFSAKKIFTMERLIKGYHMKNGPAILIECRIMDKDMKMILDLGAVQWADWAKNGNILYSKDGKLFRIKQDLKSASVFNPEKAGMIADFNDGKFENMAPPANAAIWAKQ